MATTGKNGSVLQVWLPHPMDERLRKQAQTERRSLSQTIRLAVEDRLRRGGEGQALGGNFLGLARRGAGSEGDDR